MPSEITHDKESQNKREGNYTNHVKNWLDACEIKKSHHQTHPHNNEINQFTSKPKKAEAKNKMENAHESSTLKI